MRSMSGRAIESVEADLERLPMPSDEELDARWRELYGAERPRRMYGELLIGVLPYRLQERALGDSNLRPGACSASSPETRTSGARSTR
jgi:hypothetical protein